MYKTEITFSISQWGRWHWTAEQCGHQWWWQLLCLFDSSCFVIIRPGNFICLGYFMCHKNLESFDELDHEIASLLFMDCRFCFRKIRWNCKNVKHLWFWFIKGQFAVLQKLFDSLIMLGLFIVNVIWYVTWKLTVHIYLDSWYSMQNIFDTLNLRKTTKIPFKPTPIF